MRKVYFPSEYSFKPYKIEEFLLDLRKDHNVNSHLNSELEKKEEPFFPSLEQNPEFKANSFQNKDVSLIKLVQKKQAIPFSLLPFKEQQSFSEVSEAKIMSYQTWFMSCGYPDFFYKTKESLNLWFRELENENIS